jgi:hypothetical protein
MKKSQLLSLIVILILNLTSITGCISEKNIFQLISWEIIDKESFPSLQINFNASEHIQVKFFHPNNQILYENTFDKGLKNITMFLSKFSRTSPEAGKYVLKIYDKYNKKIYQKNFEIEIGTAYISWCKAGWIKENNKYSLIKLDLRLISYSQTPFYPTNVKVSLDDTTRNITLFPSYVLNPYNVLEINFPLYFSNISAGKHSLKISLYDGYNNLIADYSSFVIPSLTNFDIIKYEWEYENSYYSLEIPRLDFLYEYYHGRERLKTNDYTVYVIDKGDEEYFKLISNKLENICPEKGDTGKINFIASFIQSLPYASDNVTTPSDEYPRYPVETLFDKEGDCEDTSILTAAILYEIGYDVSLIKFSDHMGVGVHLDGISYANKDYYTDSTGKKYLYLETTGEKWYLGKAPSNYTNRKDVTVYPVLSKPLLIHTWQAKRIIGNTFDIVKLNVAVNNIGSAKARNVQVEAAFWTNENVPLNLVKSGIFDIKGNVDAITTLKLDVPQGISTVLKVRIKMSGQIVDESVSAERFY